MLDVACRLHAMPQVRRTMLPKYFLCFFLHLIILASVIGHALSLMFTIISVRTVRVLYFLFK